MMNKTLSPIAAALALAAGSLATQAQAVPTELYFAQYAGFDDDTLVATPDPLSNGTFQSQFLLPRPALYPADVFGKMEWRGSNTNPYSSLELDSFTDTDSPYKSTGDADALWEQNELWTIARFTHINNEISVWGTPLWTMTALANLGVYLDAARTTPVFEDFPPPADTTFSFSETFNQGGNVGACTGPNPHGSACDDFFTVAQLELSDLVIPSGDPLYNYVFSFKVRIPPQAGTGPILVETPASVTAYTIETKPGTSIFDIQMAWRLQEIPQVPEPATLSLMGLGLLGLGWASRRRRAA